MARIAGKMRADMRAMEEQRERHNPVRGRGATPSMGLSQFRGGAYGCGDSESDEEMEGGGPLSSIAGMFGGPMLGQIASMAGLGRGGGTGAGEGGMTRMVGAGEGGRRRRGKAVSEAMLMGHHLGKHLHSLHGGGFFDDFGKGFMSVIRPAAGIAKSLAPLLGPEGMAASGVLGAIGLGRHRGRGTGGATNSDTGAYNGKGTGGRRGRGTGAGREVDDRAMTGLGTGAGEGCGTGGRRRGGGFLSDLGIPIVSQLAGVVGLGTGAGEGGRRRGRGTGAGQLTITHGGADDLQGSGFLSDLIGNVPLVGGPASAITGMFGLGNDGGRRRRAPAGANDGRRKRAEIVKRVMRERGVKMIEASSIVKREGLY